MRRSIIYFPFSLDPGYVYKAFFFSSFFILTIQDWLQMGLKYCWWDGIMEWRYLEVSKYLLHEWLTQKVLNPSMSHHFLPNWKLEYFSYSILETFSIPKILKIITNDKIITVKYFASQNITYNLWIDISESVRGGGLMANFSVLFSHSYHLDIMCLYVYLDRKWCLHFPKSFTFCHVVHSFCPNPIL